MDLEGQADRGGPPPAYPPQSWKQPVTPVASGMMEGEPHECRMSLEGSRVCCTSGEEREGGGGKTPCCQWGGGRWRQLVRSILGRCGSLSLPGVKNERGDRLLCDFGTQRCEGELLQQGEWVLGL